MTFVQLYGIELDRELGSSDRSVLFTEARRKAAINAGYLEFVERTECLVKTVEIPLVDGTQEYVLETTATDFLRIDKNGLTIKIVDGSSTRYIEGPDLPLTSIATLQAERPGWRALSAGTPTHIYLRRGAGTTGVSAAAQRLGLVPAPDITGAQVWTARLAYVVQPADLSLDADEPFTTGSGTSVGMRPFHRALVHFAAFDLEKLRKDDERQATQLRLFESYVTRFQMGEQPKGGQQVRMAKSYRGGRVSGRVDPRVFP